MSSVKLLTIATINLNNATGLQRTINSFKVLRKFNDIEFIFQDGNSSDESLNVAEQFYSKEEIVSERDRGIYDAMNRTLHRGTGKFIIWINSGDEFLPNVIEIIFKTLKFIDNGIVSCGFEIHSDTDSRFIAYSKPSYKDLPYGTLPHPATFFLREDLIQIGGYDETYKIASDRDLILKLFFRKSCILFLDAVISKFYIGGISASRSLWLENIKINKKYNLISTTRFFILTIRYYLSSFSWLSKHIRLYHH